MNGYPRPRRLAMTGLASACLVITMAACGGSGTPKTPTAPQVFRTSTTTPSGSISAPITPGAYTFTSGPVDRDNVLALLTAAQRGIKNAHITFTGNHTAGDFDYDASDPTNLKAAGSTTGFPAKATLMPLTQYVIIGSDVWKKGSTDQKWTKQPTKNADEAPVNWMNQMNQFKSSIKSVEAVGPMYKGLQFFNFELDLTIIKDKTVTRLTTQIKVDDQFHILTAATTVEHGNDKQGYTFSQDRINTDPIKVTSPR